MDLLLVHPGEAGVDPVTEHLGIASLKAYAEEKGFTANTLDMNLEACDIQGGIDKIKSGNPKVLGVSLLDATKRKGLALIRGLYLTGYTGHVIVGGYLPTFHAREILQAYPEIGFAVRGEGELTLIELLKYLLDGSLMDPELIAGITYRNGNKIIENPARSLIKYLDELPMPDRKYAPLILEKEKHIRLSFSRGCWAHCSFCDIISLYGISPGKKWRRRSVTGFVDEIVDLYDKFGADYFIFNDDNFLTKGKKNQKMIDDFVAEIRKRDVKIKFDMMCRADSVQKEAMQKLKSIGLQGIFLGIESFDQAHLDRYNKDTTVYQNLRAIIILYQLRIEFVISIILADAFTRLRDLIVQFYVLYKIQHRYFFNKNCKISINQKLEIYRGSTLYEQYRAMGLLYKDDWYEGYDYQLKFLTELRLKLIKLEGRLYTQWRNFQSDIKKASANTRLSIIKSFVIFI